MTALQPFRVANTAFISSTSSKPAEPTADNRTMGKAGIVKGNPGAPPPMKMGVKEVPLPSQEGTKGVMQYALYVRAVAKSQPEMRNTDVVPQHHTRRCSQLGTTRFPLAHDLRSRMLRH